MDEVPVPPALVDFIKKYRMFFIVGHKEPDGDCIGSQLALFSFLKRMGKIAYLCSVGPFSRTEILPFEKMFQDTIPDQLKSKDSAVFILDCSNRQRTGKLSDCLSGLPLAVIDHHATGDAFGDLVFIDPNAPSVSYLILKLILASGGEPTPQEAEYLLFGLCTDTGFFRHVDNSGAEVFRAVARMVDAGASPKAVFRMIYGGKTLKSRRLMGEILTRTESYFDGRLLISYETLLDASHFGLESRDSDMLYQLLQNISGCEAVMLIRQETESNCTVGLRSREFIDVDAIASAFGGGGHKRAAGLSIPGTIETVKEKLLAAFKNAFSSQCKSM